MRHINKTLYLKVTALSSAFYMYTIHYPLHLFHPEHRLMCIFFHFPSRSSSSLSSLSQSLVWMARWTCIVSLQSFLALVSFLPPLQFALHSSHDEDIGIGRRWEWWIGLCHLSQNLVHGKGWVWCILAKRKDFWPSSSFRLRDQIKLRRKQSRRKFEIVISSHILAISVDTK